jgi:hemolysin III
MTARTAANELVPRLRGVSHAGASVLAIAAAAVVIVLAPAGRATVAAAIYGAGLIALFCCSALYHRWPGPARFKPVLQRLDHSTIFVFIAASYTPIALVLLHGSLVWVILGVAWAGALAGVAFWR